MNDDRPRQKISVEDLLRIKRAEQPPAEFWTRFEHELRAKQLAAIVEKRPWWYALSRVSAGVARLHLPLGATAVLAVTFLTVREYRGPSTDHDLPVPAVSSMAVATPSARSVTRYANVSAPAPAVTVAAVAPAPQPAQLAVRTDEPALSTVKPGEIAQVISGLGDSAPADDNQHVSNPAFRFINTAVQSQSVESESVVVVDNTHGFESRGLPARMTEPLAQLPTPQTVSMRNRYLGTALPTGYSTEPTAASSPSRMMNHIQGSQLHPDDFSRIEAHGESLSIKL
jgi:hypothetical protein